MSQAIAYGYEPDVTALRAVLDDLDQRGLLHRAQIVKVGDVSIQLVDVQPAPAPLTEEQEQKREEAKVEPIDPETLLLAASEGFA